MIVLLSPAKTIDVESEPVVDSDRQPLWLDRSETLAEAWRTRTATQLAESMKISASLAELNRRRWSDWEQPIPSAGSSPALYAFRGDVYRGLAADRWTPKQVLYADDHVRILSGLHGMLRPLDRILPYRLEMGTRVGSDISGAIGGSKDLYAYWGDDVADRLDDDVAATKSRSILNLASKEYSRVARLDRAGVGVVSPVFEEMKDGTPKMITLYAKIARGAMASWVVRKRVRSAEGLKRFAEVGYRFDETRSSPERPVFVRG